MAPRPIGRAQVDRLDRVGVQFTPLRYFALDGTDHPTHQPQASMIRRYMRLAEPQTPTTRHSVNS
jgi:hypothetical protein